MPKRIHAERIRSMMLRLRITPSTGSNLCCLFIMLAYFSTFTYFILSAYNNLFVMIEPASDYDARVADITCRYATPTCDITVGHPYVGSLSIHHYRILRNDDGTDSSSSLDTDIAYHSGQESMVGV